MQFKYIASELGNKIVEGEVEAQNLGEVLSFLAGKGWKPVSVKEVKKSFLTRFNLGQIDIADQIFLSKYLSLMLQLGTDLLQAVNILIQDLVKVQVKSFLIELRTAIEKGQPFYSVFARYPKVFSDVYINLIRVGEASGSLDKVFYDLSEMLDKQKTLRDQIKGALIYPIILLIGSVAVLFLLVTFALPKIAKVFLEGGVEPPAFSRIVFSIGLFFNDYLGYVIVSIVLIVGGSIFAYKWSLSVRHFISSFFANIPIVKELIKKIAIQRFAAIFASLVKSGMSLTEALEITAKAVGNAGLQDALLRISREGLAKGLTVGEAFNREPFFPRTVVNLITISEKSGSLDKILDTLSGFYIQEINSNIKVLVSLLEPMLLVGIGGAVGLIALSIIVPIYQLTTAF